MLAAESLEDQMVAATVAGGAVSGVLGTLHLPVGVAMQGTKVEMKRRNLHADTALASAVAAAVESAANAKKVPVGASDAGAGSAAATARSIQ